MFKEKYFIYRTNLDTPDYAEDLPKSPDLRVLMAEAAEFKNPVEKMKLGQKDALKMVRKKKGSELIADLKSYNITDYKELSLALVKAMDAHLVVDHLLDDLNPGERIQVAEAMIKHMEGDMLAANLKAFDIQLMEVRQDLALKLARSNEGHSVARHLPNFQLEDDSQVASVLINSGKGYAVARYIHNFKSDHYPMAEAIVKQGNKDGLDHLGELNRRLPDFHLTKDQHTAIKNSLVQ